MRSLQVPQPEFQSRSFVQNYKQRFGRSTCSKYLFRFAKRGSLLLYWGMACHVANEVATTNGGNVCPPMFLGQIDTRSKTFNLALAITAHSSNDGRISVNPCKRHVIAELLCQSESLANCVLRAIELSFLLINTRKPIPSGETRGQGVLGRRLKG